MKNSEPENYQYSFAAGEFSDCDDEFKPATEAESVKYLGVDAYVCSVVDLETGYVVETEDIQCYAVDTKTVDGSESMKINEKKSKTFI